MTQRRRSAAEIHPHSSQPSLRTVAAQTLAADVDPATGKPMSAHAHTANSSSRVTRVCRSDLIVSFVNVHAGCAIVSGGR
jgi:hypothetical protein